ncbi:head-tail joining protein [Pseudomonas indica]|uniref:Uncharacterized protein n=1 Tax=Pseudomonas indica TaxID=137658 RepID=A0A1G8V5I8_9PSED|nr:hypothetical protein [Pseudomonas indica]SDJ61114.1 hypothetical protein SAMN05216186_10299 [Pseudomonas indica]
MASFSEMTEAMDRMVLDTLADDLGSYRNPQGKLVADKVQVIIDRNLQRVGPDGAFQGAAVGITWRKAQLATVDRGGQFCVGRRRYVVDELIEDDCHMLTAACTEQR